MVIEWGGTTQDLVKGLLDAEPEIKEKCLGVILNRVDLNKLSLYSAEEAVR
jgi:succinoglycan biosynthesis transport protein ExoP